MMLLNKLMFIYMNGTNHEILRKTSFFLFLHITIIIIITTSSFLCLLFLLLFLFCSSTIQNCYQNNSILVHSTMQYFSMKFKKNMSDYAKQIQNTYIIQEIQKKKQRDWPHHI